MKITQKGIFYAAAFALIGYFLYREYKNRKPAIDKSKTVDQVKAELAPRATIVAQINNHTIYTELKKGDSGGMVELLQMALNAWLLPGSKITVDGKFGSGTESAIYNLYGKKTASFEFVQNTKPKKKGYSYGA